MGTPPTNPKALDAAFQCQVLLQELQEAYNLIKMAKEKELITASSSRWGQFQYQGMPFGLTNAPASFQHVITDTLRDHLDIYCTAFIDDNLMYSENIEEHQAHV